MRQFWVIFVAELLRRLRSRAFIVGLIFGGVGVAFMTLLPSLLSSLQFAEMRSLAIAGPHSLVTPAAALLRRNGDFSVRVVPEPKRAPTVASLGRYHAGSLLELSEENGRLHVSVYARDPSNVELAAIRGPLLPLDLALSTHRSPDELRRELNFPVTVHSVTARFGNAAAAESAHTIAFVLLFLLYMLIVFNSQLVLTSVAEEKTSRIAELLVASVDLTTLLCAKVFASTCLAALQMATWIVIGFALSHGSSGGGTAPTLLNSVSIGSVPTVVIAGFLVFFVLGFLQMAVLFAGAGSLVNRTEDLGAIGGPLFLPVIAAFVIAILALSSPDAPFAVVCSLLPIFSPFVMFSRLAVSNVPEGQIVAAIVIDVASVIFFSLLGGRLYRIGMLLYGRSPSWPQIVNTMVRR